MVTSGVTLQAVDKIDRFDPKTNTWVEYPVPYPETDIRRIEVDPKHPNRIWWTGTCLATSDTSRFWTDNLGHSRETKSPAGGDPTRIAVPSEHREPRDLSLRYSLGE